MKHETALRLNPGDEIILKGTGESYTFVSYRYINIIEIESKLQDSNLTLYRHRRDFRLPKVDPNAKLRVQYEQDEKVYPRPQELWQFKISENSPEWGSSIPNWVKGFIYRRHPHADNMIQYEKDKQWHPRPWELWELVGSDDQTACYFDKPLQWDTALRYRRKPFVVNGIKLEHEPLRVMPATGTVYAASPSNPDGYFVVYQHGFKRAIHLLQAGLLYLTPGAAKAHSDAMVAPSRVPK